MMTMLLAIALLQQPEEKWIVIDGEVTFSDAGLRMVGPAHANLKPLPARPRGVYRLSSSVRQASGSGAYMVALIWRDRTGKVLQVDNDWMGKDRPDKASPHGGRFTAPQGTHDAVVALGVEAKTVCVFKSVDLQFEEMASLCEITLRWLDLNGEPIEAPLKSMVKPDWFEPAKQLRNVTDWKPVASGFRSSSFPVVAGRMYVVEADARRVSFAPATAVRAEVHATLKGEFKLDSVRLAEAAMAGLPAQRKPPTVWICPDFRVNPNSLFKSNSPWQTTRSGIKCYKFHLRMLSDSDRHGDWIRDWQVDLPPAIGALKEAGIGIAVETAGLYGNQPGQTGLQSARAELAILNRLFEAGGRVQALTLDGPISRVIKGGRPPGDGGAAGTLGYSLAESVDHLVAYIETVHRAHPGIEIGLIVNFAHWDFEGRESYFGASSYSAGSGYSYNEVLDAVLARGSLIRFVHADSPFDYLTSERSPYNPRWKGERDRLLALEAYCRRKGLKFGLICNTEARQSGSDREFYEQTLQALQLYRAAGGQPDSFTVESWFEFPRQLLPETKPYTFTGLTRDFVAQVRWLYPP
ncbi:MAG: hypothetical protein VB878_23705 [Pirellulaceae bacterium]